MVVPADREGRSHDPSQSISETASVSSRKAGGRQDVAVDQSVCYFLLCLKLIVLLF